MSCWLRAMSLLAAFAADLQPDPSAAWVRPFQIMFPICSYHLRLSTRRGLPLRCSHAKNAAPSPSAERGRSRGDHRPHPPRNRIRAVPARGPVHLYFTPAVAGLYRLPPADLVSARAEEADGFGRRTDRAPRRL